MDQPERFTYGKFWRFDDVILEPVPVQSPHPPLWVSAGRDASIRAAAERGLHLLLDQFTPAETLRERIAVYRDAAGPRFDPTMIAVARDVYIADSDSELEDALRRRAVGHQRMIDAAHASTTSGSHILAWAAHRPEGRTERVVWLRCAGRSELAALRGSGVTAVLCNILGHHRPTLRRMARFARPAEQVGRRREDRAIPRTSRARRPV